MPKHLPSGWTKYSTDLWGVFWQKFPFPLYFPLWAFLVIWEKNKIHFICKSLRSDIWGNNYIYEIRLWLKSKEKQRITNTLMVWSWLLPGVENEKCILVMRHDTHRQTISTETDYLCIALGKNSQVAEKYLKKVWRQTDPTRKLWIRRR